MIEATDFTFVWRRPLAERMVVAFERDLSNRTVDRLLPDKADREAVVAAKHSLKDAWNRNQLPQFVGVALALNRIGALNINYARRLAWALMTQERCEQAAAVSDRAQPEEHQDWCDRARALAGAGRVGDAVQAASDAIRLLESAPSGLDLQAEIHRIDRRTSPLDRAAGWSAARHLVRKKLQSGAPAKAEQALRRFHRDRISMLIEAIGSAREDGPAEAWPAVRRRIAAGLLLGLGDKAAAALTEGRPQVRPVSDPDDTAPVLRALAASAEVTAVLVEAMGALWPAGAAREFAGLAARALTSDDACQKLIAAPRPSSGVAVVIATALARAGRLAPAIILFGELSRDDETARQDLAACQSLDTTARSGFRTEPRPRPRRVLDLFPYNGELEVLKIKLCEMAPWVERFVVVEAAETFTGRPKPLRFGEAKDEIAAFLPKITYLPIERFPDHVRSPWGREFHQRDQAIQGLRGLCAPDDIVLLTDADEIIERSAVERFEGEAAPLTMQYFRYFLNCRLTTEQRGNASIWRARQLQFWGSSLARTVLAAAQRYSPVVDAGWHFSSIGDAQAIALKLASYSHQENDRPDNEARFGALIERLQGGSCEADWEICAPGLLPACVRDDSERLKALLL